MSLQVWLPLNGDLRNLGLYDTPITNNGVAVDNNGKIGKCYSFNGTSSYITLNSLTCNEWTEFSLSCWCYPTTDFNYLFLIRGGGAHRVRISGDGFMFRDNNNSSQRIIGFGATIPLNTWSHLTCIYKRGEIFMYINGIQTNHSTAYYHTDSKFLSDHNEVRIGRSQSSSGNNYYTGKINDFRIYNHALSVKEIKEIYKTLVLHYKLDNGGMGIPNLIPRSIYSVDPWLSSIKAQETYDGKFAYRLAHNTLYSKTSNGTLDIFNNTITYKVDTQYTLSIDWRDDYRTDNKNSSWYLRFFYTDGSTATQIISPSNTIKKWTHSVMTSAAGKTISAIRTTYGNGGQLYFANLKLEEGTQETGYSISQEEINTFYDSSGYSNNAVPVGTITTSNSSPRYNVSTNFNGASAIKVSDNNWVSQKMREMTINLWVRPTASFSKLFSCTESGGWNTESGNSGYLRFPIYVYTDAAQTSRAYKYDSKELQVSAVPLNEWTMLTFIYDENGTRTYINGELHHTYINTSYGISYNTGARLFLGCEANAANPTSPYFTGQMSDFRLYATALAADDIKELYHTPYSADRNGNIYAREVVEI